MPIVLTVLAFVWWWPLGLLMLGFLLARTRFGCWRRPIHALEGPMSDWEHYGDRIERKMVRMQDKMERKMERMRFRMERARGRGGWFAPPSSGNRAFDDYREETLKRLEDEQREFKEFLERLRFAKDRAEFDQFMAERRQRPFEPGAQPETPPEPRS